MKHVPDAVCPYGTGYSASPSGPAAVATPPLRGNRARRRPGRRQRDLLRGKDPAAASRQAAAAGAVPGSSRVVVGWRHATSGYGPTSTIRTTGPRGTTPSPAETSPVQRTAGAPAGRSSPGAHVLPRTGDVLHVTRAASVQFLRPIKFRVIRVLDWPTYDGWLWLDGYELNAAGDAVTRRSIFVQREGLQQLQAAPEPRAAHRPGPPARSPGPRSGWADRRRSAAGGRAVAIESVRPPRHRSTRASRTLNLGWPWSICPPCGGTTAPVSPMPSDCSPSSGRGHHPGPGPGSGAVVHPADRTGARTGDHRARRRPADGRRSVGHEEPGWPDAGSRSTAGGPTRPAGVRPGAGGQSAAAGTRRSGSGRSTAPPTSAAPCSGPGSSASPSRWPASASVGTRRRMW